MAKPHVLIAGAGIGGITAALALIGRGFPVDIYEQAAELGELGAGVQIAPNGSRVLCELGLEQAMAAIASIPAGKEVRLFSTGQAWKLQDLGAEAMTRYAAPYWMVHRGDFHRVLANALLERAPASLHVGARVTGFEQNATGVTLLLSNGQRVSGEVLIGADGVHSQIRRTLFGEGRATFTGFMAWRGVVPTERLPERLRRPFGVNWIGPHGHVVTYPLRRGELLNFVTAIERDDWRVESWSERGTVAECRRDFSRWHGDVQEIIGCIDIPYKWALLGREPLTRWSEGRVSLLGDACHPTLPFLAQGANMALEDGLILTRCLEAAADVPAALQRYDRARVERTARIVQGALDNVGRFHNPVLADPGPATEFLDREFAPDRVQQRYDWIWDYDARSVAI